VQTISNRKSASLIVRPLIKPQREFLKFWDVLTPRSTA